MFAVAQHKIKFSNHTNIGLLHGSSQNELSVQTINGIKYKQWSAGIGIGIDNYGYNTVPLFIDVRKSFGNELIKPFVFANVGLSMPVRTKDFPEKWTTGMDAYKLHKSFYSEAGAGLYFKQHKHKRSFFASIGYTYKRFAYDELNHNPISSYWYPIDIPITYQFDYFRIAVRAGIHF